MEKINISEIVKRTVPAGEYVAKIIQPFKEKFLERKQTYQLNEKVTSKLRE